MLGKCHRELISILFGGSLGKKSVEIRPNAIGYTLRKIAAECASYFVLSLLGNKLLPIQFDLGLSGGWKAAVHATRWFIDEMLADFVIATLHFELNLLCEWCDKWGLTINFN